MKESQDDFNALKLIIYSQHHAFDWHPPRGFHFHLYFPPHLVVKPERFTPQIIPLITEWNQSLDPSFGMVKNQFKKFVETDAVHA